MQKSNPPQQTIQLTDLPFQTDNGAGSRARLGLIVLSSDYSIEQDYRRVLARLPGVALYISRIPMSGQTTNEDLAAMAQSLTSTTELLLPGQPFDVVAYGCSSATCVIGEQRVAELVQVAKPTSQVTNPITAATVALRAFGAKRIGILTPYTTPVNSVVTEYFRHKGYQVAVVGSFGQVHDSTIGKITPEQIRYGVSQVAKAGKMDAIYISCTNLRALQIMEQLEEDTGLPVTSSNHALIWHSLRLAGVNDRLDGFGRLYKLNDHNPQRSSSQFLFTGKQVLNNQDIDSMKGQSDASTTIRMTHLPFDTDKGTGNRARLGLILPATNSSVQEDYRNTLAHFKGVSYYATRIAFPSQITTQTLASMANNLTTTASLLLSGQPMNVIAYACSSGASVIGEQRVAELIQTAKPGTHVTNPITAATVALKAFGAQRIGVLTPYIAEVNTAIEANFRDLGFDIAVFGSFDELLNENVGKITLESTRKAVRKMASVCKVDAIFVSCTNLRVLQIIQQLESDTGVPVTSSNHAMLWHSLRLAGITENPGGLGKLFEMPIK